MIRKNWMSKRQRREQKERMRPIHAAQKLERIWLNEHLKRLPPPQPIRWL